MGIGAFCCLSFLVGPRTERLTAKQADAVRTWAHIVGWHSIALAQTPQFELMRWQRDCIGEMATKELSVLDEIPSGAEPVVINEATGMPWTVSEYRRKWRNVARYAGLPDSVFNTDYRAGGITEVFEAGIAGDRVQKPRPIPTSG